MARPVEIDRDQTFEVASQLFWRRGYRSTSLQQLLDEMGIGKSSFYAAFVSKEALFLNVLAAYWAATEALFSRIRSTESGLAAIRAFLELTLLKISDEERRRGCLAINSTLELEGVDQQLYDHAAQILGKLELEFHSLLMEAESIGELRTDQTPEELAQLLVMMIQGIRVSSRRGMSRSQARVAIETLMQLFTKTTHKIH